MRQLLVRDRLIAELSQSSLSLNIRAAVRGLWTGVITSGQFYQEMVLAIEKGVYQAFREGFREFGIEMDEISTDEKGAMFNFVADQAGFIGGFAQVIMDQSKANGGKLGPLFDRASMWINRYGDARNLARVFAAKNQHLTWVLGPTEHCSSCLKLAGKVKRGNFWLEADLRPQHPALECGGYRCQCMLVPTDMPASRGPLPRIP